MGQFAAVIFSFTVTTNQHLLYRTGGIEITRMADAVAQKLTLTKTSNPHTREVRYRQPLPLV